MCLQPRERASRVRRGHLGLMHRGHPHSGNMLECAGPGQAGISQRLGFPRARTFRLFGLPVLTGVLTCGHELADIVAAPAGILERHLWVRAKAQQAFLAVAPIPQTPPPGAGRTGVQHQPPAVADLARFACLNRRFEGCANGLVCEDVSCRHDRVTFCHIGPIGCSYPVCYPVKSRMCVDLPGPIRTRKNPKSLIYLGFWSFRDLPGTMSGGASRIRTADLWIMIPSL